MKWMLLGLVALAPAIVTPAAEGKLSPAQKCVIGKFKAVTKLVTADLKCHRAAALTGAPVAQPCLDAASGALTVAFAKLEGKFACPIAGNAVDITSDADLASLQIATHIGSSGVTTTTTSESTTTTTAPGGCAHCADVFNGVGGTPCPGSQTLADAFAACICSGACAAPCAAACPIGQTQPDQMCVDCSNDVVSGCGTDAQNCLNDQ